MNVNANDFGCVPDGRFLERACIEAGSAELFDADGTLRPTDVGKNIAIPGAADLVTTIVALADHREVKDAVMDADSDILTGTLINPATDPQAVEGFGSTHKGRRITVEGALNGNMLVTDIVEILQPDKIRLADKATVSVSGTLVILDEPNRVALADYARRCAANLTFDLQDRTINDGEMIIGGRALFSETAKFSSLDLGKPVIIQDAGLLVTTIKSFKSNTQVTLAAPAQRSVLEGQADVWKTDSRPGLEQLLACLEHMEAEPVDIYFGPGIYDFQRSPNTTGLMNGIIGLLGKKNLTFRGAGSGVTVLRLMPQQDLEHANTHVIETRDCRRLNFHDFSIHGAYLTMGKTNEQMHGLFLNQGSEEIGIERVRIFQSAGDGIRLLGKAEDLDLEAREKKVRNVRVEGCQLIQNKRSGLAFQREVEFVSIRNCYIEMIPPSTDSCIDLEPTGNKKPGEIFVSPTDLIFESNFMRHCTPAPAVSISGFAGPDPARRVKFSNNQITGGHIECTDVSELTIQNNTIRVTSLTTPLGTGQRPPVYVKLGGDRVIISGNVLVNEDTKTRAVILLEGEIQGDRELKRTIVANNLCFARTGAGIACRSGHDVAISDNLVVATDPCNAGIAVRSQSGPMNGISVRDNDITVEGTGTWATGIHLSADPNTISSISVTTNSIRGAKKGVFFEDSGYEPMPVCALNRIARDVEIPFDGPFGGMFEIVTGGATSRGGKDTKPGAGRLMVGQGTPENTVTGNVGDLFQRLDENAETLYVKEAGNDTSTGWNPK